MQMEDRGLTEILNNPELGQHRVNEARDRIAPLVSSIVERAKEAGVLRSDFDSTDAIFIQVAWPPSWTRHAASPRSSTAVT